MIIIICISLWYIIGWYFVYKSLLVIGNGIYRVSDFITNCIVAVSGLAAIGVYSYALEQNPQHDKEIKFLSKK